MPIKILSYNIQAGIGTQSFAQYLTQVVRQVLHTPPKTRNIRAIGRLIANYDVACLQEVDLGGRRSGFSDQVEILAAESGMIEYVSQENRVVRKISRHGNAILSHLPQADAVDLKLPGKRGGRGALTTRIINAVEMQVINLHLSLGLADQMTQVEFIAQHARRDQPLIICGDFNCTASSKPVQYLCRTLDLKPALPEPSLTYPSWKPTKDFDHILVSRSVRVISAGIVSSDLSDHAPVETVLDL